MIKCLNVKNENETTMTDLNLDLYASLAIFDGTYGNSTIKELCTLIQMQSEKLFSAADDITKSIKGRTKYDYIKKFDQIKKYFNWFKDNFNNKLSKDRFDYKSLDKRIREFFLYNISYSQNRFQQILTFSESKFNRFLLLIEKHKHYNNLGDTDRLDYGYMSLVQIIYIQK